MFFVSVDGGWTAWSSWGTCTVSCGGGSQQKDRTCTNPTPQYGGAQCQGVTFLTQTCNTQVCISKYFWWNCVILCYTGYVQ